MAARSKVPPVVDGNTIDGACSPGPGLPTWKAYWPAWFVVVDDPPVSAALRKKIAARATIATAAMTTAITPGLRPCLFRIMPLREGAAFFGGTEAFPLPSLYVVFVCNWFLLHCLCFFRFDSFFHSWYFCRFLAAVCSTSYLPVCVPGEST